MKAANRLFHFTLNTFATTVTHCTDVHNFAIDLKIVKFMLYTLLFKVTVRSIRIGA